MEGGTQSTRPASAERDPSLRWAGSHGESTGWTHAGTTRASPRRREEPAVLTNGFYFLPCPALGMISPAGAKLEDGERIPFTFYSLLQNHLDTPTISERPARSLSHSKSTYSYIIFSPVYSRTFTLALSHSPSHTLPLTLSLFKKCVTTRQHDTSDAQASVFVLSWINPVTEVLPAVTFITVCFGPALRFCTECRQSPYFGGFIVKTLSRVSVPGGDSRIVPVLIPETPHLDSSIMHLEPICQSLREGIGLFSQLVASISEEQRTTPLELPTWIPPQNEACPICHDTFPGKPWVVTNCQHAFHKECLGTWLERGQNCPICRGSLGDPARQ
ncbi:hypothetical protein TEQG_03073 [Trichophyton equinum CBS 127.97]|uniref:RING-type domain-containing protein n=1 Tax=Trichophyton equinum (strain ATCC MYA-4606 / CBS 127.97) TaxID=559882 RepID=F2PQ71_TRIEC|nr:hypothetical protein TEQG_03073 [Trichophyton equinum CBS 127.97]